MQFNQVGWGMFLVVLTALIAGPVVGQTQPSTSASSGTAMAPPPPKFIQLDLYTSVPKLFLLEKGMTLETVVATLECEPHAIIQHTEGGYLMLEWRYVHQDRWISAQTQNQAEERTKGDDYWTQPSSVYLMFDNKHTFINYVTEEGLGSMRDAFDWQASATTVGSVRTTCQTFSAEVPSQFQPPTPPPSAAEADKGGERQGLAGRINLPTLPTVNN